jgi:hypothetical protein
LHHIAEIYYKWDLGAIPLDIYQFQSCISKLLDVSQFQICKLLKIRGETFGLRETTLVSIHTTLQSTQATYVLDNRTHPVLPSPDQDVPKPIVPTLYTSHEAPSEMLSSADTNFPTLRASFPPAHLPGPRLSP